MAKGSDAPTTNPMYRKIAGLDPVLPVDTTPAKDLGKLLAGDVKPEEVGDLDLNRVELKDVNAKAAEKMREAEAEAEVAIAKAAEKSASSDEKKA